MVLKPDRPAAVPSAPLPPGGSVDGDVVEDGDAVDHVSRSVVGSSSVRRTFSPSTWLLTVFVPGAGFGPLE